MLRVTSISVGYGNVPVLRDVSFEVGEGELVALIGSNGAGKTTTLNAISALIPLISGTIWFFENELGNVPPHRVCELGFVHIPEGRKIFSSLTVLENIEMGAYTRGAREKTKPNKEVVFDLFPILKARGSQLARTLSGGEQQMLAIARGLMSNPRLLALDEPSLGLGPIIKRDIFETIGRINQEGITILLSEQDAMHALSMARRAYVLEVGRVVVEGEGSVLLEHEHVRKAYLGI